MKKLNSLLERLIEESTAYEETKNTEYDETKNTGEETVKHSKDKESDIIKCFDKFWAKYPRKQGKLSAEKKWVSKKLNKLTNIIIEDIDFRLTNYQPNGWLDKKTGLLCDANFIPLPATYLNNERWDDEFCE